MIAHTGQMTLQGILPLRLRLGVMIILEGCEGHLGVDNHIALVGEMQNGIGDKAVPLLLVHHIAVLVAYGLLQRELLSLLKAHSLQKLLQAKLAEVALRLVLACQGLRQLIGPFAHLTALLNAGLDGRIQSLHGGVMLAVGALHRLAHLLNVRLQGRKDTRELLLVDRRQLIRPLLQNPLRSRIHLFTDEAQLLPHLLLLLLLLFLPEYPLLLFVLLMLKFLLLLQLPGHIQQVLQRTHLRAHHHPNGNTSQYNSDK